LEEEAKIEAMKIASELRKAGIAVIMATGDKSLRGQMRQVNSLGIAYALILGKQEISKRNVMLRDMRSGEQKTIPLAEIAGILKQLKI
jgi:histidyl-tRNA synthetase